VLEAQAHAADCVCEEGWVVPEQQWAGVAVAALLARAGVQPAACFLKVYAGAYTVLLPLEEALTGGALLARRLHGQPLTLAPGAPLRLVAPGWAGAPSAGPEAHLLDSTHRVMESSPPPRCGDQYGF
jgi:DMSO/TMAO reductase YedYZ molybdopterin-dependent catalytic subunit